MEENMKEKRFVGFKLDPDLHDECKITAIRQGLSFEALAGYALQNWLDLSDDDKSLTINSHKEIEIS